MFPKFSILCASINWLFFIALHLEDILKYMYKSYAKFYYKVQCLIYQRYFNCIKLFLKPQKKDMGQCLFLEGFICLSRETQTGLPDLSSSFLLPHFWLRQNLTSYNTVSPDLYIGSCTVLIPYMCCQAPLSVVTLKEFF